MLAFQSLHHFDIETLPGTVTYHKPELIMTPGGKVIFCRKADFFGMRKPLAAACQEEAANDIFFPTRCSGFQLQWLSLPIGGRRRKFLLESERFGGRRRQKIIWRQDDLETTFSGGGCKTGGEIFAFRPPE